MSMLLFDEPDYDKFFNPLSCKNKKIYYDCILRLIEKSKQVPLLYETDAKDTLELYFRNLTYAVSDDENGIDPDEAISSRKSETENAGAVLRYFRHCGWISERELGRNGDNIASITPECRKVIDSIERIFNRNNRAELTNHIFSIYDTLSSAFSTDHARRLRPYSNILVPVSDNMADLKNELLVLKDSIRSIMRVVLKMTETNALGRFLIRDEMMQKFFRDYFFIKKDGLIPGYIFEIEKMLREIVKTDVYEAMIGEYRELYEVSTVQAEDIVKSQLDEIRNFISYDYVREMDYIDKKINNYYHLYSTRVLMVYSSNVNMQTCLNHLLITIRNLGPKEKKEALEKLSSTFLLQSYKYIGRKSIERRKKRKPNTKTAMVVQSVLTDEERAALTRELLHEQPDRYGVGRAADYFDSLLAGRERLAPDRETVKTRSDAMMIAAAIIYSGSEEFPFEVEFSGGTIEMDAAEISRILIRRRHE